MAKRILLLNGILLACSRYSVNPVETAPANLSDETIKKRICREGSQTMTWVRTTAEGFNEMTFFKDKISAAYTTNTSAGAQQYNGLTFNITRDGKNRKVTIQFSKNGMHKVSETMSYLNDSIWRNDEDKIEYQKKVP